MSEAAVKPGSAKALAPILGAAAMGLVLGFVVLQYLLPALDLIEAPSNFGAGVESICAGLLAAAIMIGVRLRHLRRQSRRMRIALDNMSQGLCMFDGSERLVVCNQRYLEMYGMSPEVVRPGITLSELLQARIAAGSFSRDAQEYRRELLGQIAEGKTRGLEVTTAEGHTILVV